MTITDRLTTTPVWRERAFLINDLQGDKVTCAQWAPSLEKGKELLVELLQAAGKTDIHFFCLFAMYAIKVNQISSLEVQTGEN